MILKKGEINNAESGNGMKIPTTSAELLNMYQDGVKTANKELASISDADWEKPAVLKLDGKEVWKTSRGNMVWGFLFDSVHHRGQLSAYIRPMGGKVPSIYGPSADDQGAMM